MQAEGAAITQQLELPSPDKLAQVQGYVSSLQTGDLVHAAMLMSEPAFARVWGHPENDTYDEL